MDRERMKQRVLDKLERDGVSYREGEPGTGRLLVTDGDGEVIGKLVVKETNSKKNKSE